ncbi:FMN reductase [Leifsonia poae]|uniref:FMN reductase n=1 Tax=Leifsonia poae TaxID=110933 RepID=UPI001CBEC1E6|nr:FMN reductase [Leifsonia poae]
MTARTIAVVSAGLSQPSSSRLLADRLAEATVRRLTERGVEVAVQTIELRDTAKDVTNNLLAGFPSPALADVVETVTGADGLIVVSPIFTTSYSGMFKSFFDVIDPTALDGMPVLIGATGGTERHSLALEYAMRPMFTYLHGVVVPTSVYAASADWGSGADTVKALPDRIERAAGEFAALVSASDRSSLVKDPFTLDSDFGALLGGFSAD